MDEIFPDLIYCSKRGMFKRKDGHCGEFVGLRGIITECINCEGSDYVMAGINNLNEEKE